MTKGVALGAVLAVLTMLALRGFLQGMGGVH